MGYWILKICLSMQEAMEALHDMIKVVSDNEERSHTGEEIIGTMSTEKTFTIATDEFGRLARWTGKLTRSADSSLIVVEVADSKIVMSSFDGISMAKAQADVVQQFTTKEKFSLNGALLMSVAKGIKDKTVTCIISDGTLTIKTPKMKFSIPTTGEGIRRTLPELPPVLGKVDSHEFKSMIQHASSATSDDPTTLALTVVNIKVSPENQTLTLAGTDRYKFIVRTMEYKAAPGTEKIADFDLNVDSKNLKNLISDVDEAGDLTLYATLPTGESDDSGNKPSVGLFGVATSSQIGTLLLRDVKYVNYGHLMKHKDSAYKVVVKRSDLNAAVNTTKPLIKEAIKKGTLKLSEDGLIVSTPIADIDVETVSSNMDKELEVFVNLDFITPILAAGKSEYIRLGFNTATTPIVIEEMVDQNKSEDSFFTLVMVMTR